MNQLTASKQAVYSGSRSVWGWTPSSRCDNISCLYHRHVTLICIFYCKAVLAGLSMSTLPPLQRVLHAAFWSRVITSSALHWLPVTVRIQCKLCVLIDNSNVGHSLQYLSQLLTPMSDIQSHSALRSARNSDGCRYMIATKDQRQSFQYCRRNQLSTDLKKLQSTSSFKKTLESYIPVYSRQ